MAGEGSGEEGYRLPCEQILNLVDVAPQPLLSFSPDRTKVISVVLVPLKA